MQSDGWLCDVYPLQDAMVVWLYQDDGTLLRLEDPFRPWRYARDPREDLRRLARATFNVSFSLRGARHSR